MSDKLLDVERRALDLYNSHDTENYPTAYNEALMLVSGGVEVEGLGNLQAVASAWFAAIPDLRQTVLLQVATEELVITHWKMAGVVTGELYGIKPGTAIDVTGAYIDRIENDRIVHRREFWDAAAFFTQSGLFTPPWA